MSVENDPRWDLDGADRFDGEFTGYVILEPETRILTLQGFPRHPTKALETVSHR
ncbi:MAG: hypothetical protein JOZ58_21270 [Acetobacteraceae bacterium]|nr:hypothetical protein [Acetobacteraceae bacterium]